MVDRHVAPVAGIAEREPELKAFQFLEGRPSHADLSPTAVGKENEAPNTAPQMQQQEDPKSPQKPFPSTPAPRLPLADLIGNTDDPDRTGASVHPSPEEQIQWHAVRSPKTQNAKTPASKGTKRARSSSPPSSSQKRPAADPTRLDLNTLKKHLKTPQADPAADLWSRYSVGTANGPALSRLPFPSSPRSVEDAASNVSGLRRWTSCGIEWPSSKAKRRKVQHNPIKEQIDEAIADDHHAGAHVPERMTKKSKIGSLIERIQETLARPSESTEEKGPSSSSPLPERNESFEKRSDASSSPTRQSKSKDLPDARLLDEPEPHKQPRGDMTKMASSSGFGSDDFDINALGAAGAAVVDPSNGEGKGASAVKSKSTLAEGTVLPGASAHLVDSEEFGDDDFDEDLDMSAVDFETLATFEDQNPNVEAKRTACVTFEEQPTTLLAVVPDEFGDEDLDEETFMAAEFAATQSVYASCSSGANNDSSSTTTIQRYLIKTVSEGTYTAKNNLHLPEKVLLVEDEKTRLFKTITLRQAWYDTRCTEGCYVHVIGSFDKGGQCLIDDSQNMLILHPDHLVSTTVIADSFGCMRRAVLQDRVKATNQSSPPQLYGTILHEIFQEAIKANCWETQWLKATIATLVERHIEDIYEVKISVEQAIDYLMSKMPELQAWAKIFIKLQPGADAVVQDRNGKQVTMSIPKLLDVEEHVWSPMYGMKGNIDATVQVDMRDSEGTRTLTVPFEVKTGKNSTNTSHRAQTALYTLLLSDRYDISVYYGILYYLETSEISRIPAIRHELQHMVMQRNELACYVRERLSLPPMLKNSHTCSRCYAKTTCFLYHKLVEDGNGETSGLQDKFDQLVKHLKPAHQDFFKKWDDLLTKEETEMMKFKRELWTMLSTEREKVGRCFANVILEPSMTDEEQGASKINRFRYTFRKSSETLGFSFNQSHIAVGEPIVVSDEKGHYALAKGYVIALQKSSITVAVDRRLHNARIKAANFDANTNQNFSAIMEVGVSQSKTRSSLQPSNDIQPLLYRLDKDEFSSGLATIRNNLVQIMTDDGFQSREIRGLIVDDIEPRFKPASSAYTLSGPQSQMNINEDQKAAIEKIMTAEDYALVLGMPGTGKTTTIAHIIRALVAKGKSVLLTSYTHTAVDNILLKIREEKIGILRLGALAKIHPEVRDFAILAAEPKTSIEQLQREYHEPQVVATTCLGVNHPIFNERTFDYCIVDEASQITLPVCLGPIRMAKAFVLVGDHYQLPPLVQNREAQEGGLDISLFKLLSDRHPSAVVELRHQYRMNSAVMSLSSTLIYSGRLKCGSEEVAKRVLELPNFDALAQLHRPPSSAGPNMCNSHTSSSCWLNLALGPSSPPVVFLNTDTLLPAAREAVRGARITNSLEALLMTHLLQALLLSDLNAESIGTITLYRSQLALIKSMLQSRVPSSQLDLLEAHTTDRFQGRDKDVVLLSCVRSNDRDTVGDLLKDWRRVNVAMTRAKKKLIIVGSKGTLSGGDELLRKLVDLCEKNRWLFDLPATAAEEDAHSWPSFVTSTAPSRRGDIATSRQSKSPTKAEGYGRRQSMTNSPVREPLTARNENAVTASNGVRKAFKPPTRVGKVTASAVLGAGRSDLRAKRPVLADLVNEILGENMLDQ